MILDLIRSISTKITIIREKRSYGINKALGFTSGQLMVQTMISNIPSVIIGVVLGTLVANPVSRMLMVSTLGLFGIKSVDTSIPLYGIILTFAGIVCVAMVTSLLCSMSIRKVEPVGLLTEE